MGRACVCVCVCVCMYISCFDGPLCSNRDWDVVIAVTECKSLTQHMYNI